MIRLCLILVVAGGFLFSSLSGCKWIKEKAGITTTVSDPDPDSPEYVVYQVLKAAIVSYKDNEKAGWLMYKKLLHSRETSAGNAQLRAWREMRWATMRRKAYLFTKDKDTKDTIKDSSPTFEIAKTQEKANGKVIKIFVTNEMSDMPTPCEVKRDPKQGDKWKIVTQCLN